MIMRVTAERLALGLAPSDCVVLVGAQAELDLLQPVRDLSDNLAVLTGLGLAEPVAAVDLAEDVPRETVGGLAFAVNPLGLDHDMR